MRTASMSERLDTAVRLAGHRQDAAKRRYWSHPQAARLFPTYLFRMHCMARASVHLMESAAAELERRIDSEPIARGVVEYLRGLIPEETGHDDWLLRSLEALGVGREEVWARTPPPVLASMVGQQYYWIFHHHPVALLGFIKVVELDPSSAEDIQRVMAATGLPRGAFRYHLGHTKLELKHNDDLDRALDGLPLTPGLSSLIVLSAVRTIAAIADSTEELLDRYDRLGEAELLYDPPAGAAGTASAEARPAQLA